MTLGWSTGRFDSWLPGGLWLAFQGWDESLLHAFPPARKGEKLLKPGGSPEVGDISVALLQAPETCGERESARCVRTEEGEKLVLSPSDPSDTVQPPPCRAQGNEP